MSGVAQRPAKRGWLVAGFVASTIVQLAMIAIGVAFILDETDAGILASLFGWCLLGTLYVAVTVFVLGRMVRRDTGGGGRPTRLEISRPARIVSLAGTVIASLTGVGAAVQLMTARSDTGLGFATGVVGVWAMLLSWGLLHWGFAQLYYQEYYAAAEPTMRFPATDLPRLTDFVYFSYTLGTSFAASDVEVRDRRTRWRVTWHSVISFFFNGLIIVFALNSILNAAQG
jgi:uncharacterized membrane protein